MKTRETIRQAFGGLSDEELKKLVQETNELQATAMQVARGVTSKAAAAVKPFLEKGIEQARIIGSFQEAIMSSTSINGISDSLLMLAKRFRGISLQFDSIKEVIAFENKFLQKGYKLIKRQRGERIKMRLGIEPDKPGFVRFAMTYFFDDQGIRPSSATDEQFRECFYRYTLFIAQDTDQKIKQLEIESKTIEIRPPGKPIQSVDPIDMAEERNFKIKDYHLGEVYEILKTRVHEDDLVGLKNLLNGMKINGKIRFNGSSSILPHFFRSAMSRHYFNSNVKQDDVVKWICNNFEYQPVGSSPGQYRSHAISSTRNYVSGQKKPRKTQRLKFQDEF